MANDSTVPPGGGGADSGAADLVGIDPADRGAVQNVGSQNDAPGVGTRHGARHEKHHREHQPPHEGPALAQNVATVAEKLDGIVIQTRADLPRADAHRIREVVKQRAKASGIPLDDAQLDTLLTL